jgi:ribosomal protein S18 acetylase RimI-like enzyme
MHFTIRKIQETDFPVLLSLFMEMAVFETLPDSVTNSLEQMYRDKDYINGFVAINENNEIIAYATYFFTYFTFVGKSLYMDDLYVKKEYRSQKIGSKLIDKVIEFAKSENCSKLRWQVSKWNTPAIEFYKNLGAIIDGVESNCDLMLK